MLLVWRLATGRSPSHCCGASSCRCRCQVARAVSAPPPRRAPDGSKQLRAIRSHPWDRCRRGDALSSPRRAAQVRPSARREQRQLRRVLLGGGAGQGAQVRVGRVRREGELSASGQPDSEWLNCRAGAAGIGCRGMRASRHTHRANAGAPQSSSTTSRFCLSPLSRRPAFAATPSRRRLPPRP